jgi:hypothetical protein
MLRSTKGPPVALGECLRTAHQRGDHTAISVRCSTKVTAVSSTCLRIENRSSVRGRSRASRTGRDLAVSVG